MKQKNIDMNMIDVGCKKDSFKNEILVDKNFIKIGRYVP